MSFGYGPMMEGGKNSCYKHNSRFDNTRADLGFFSEGRAPLSNGVTDW